MAIDDEKYKKNIILTHPEDETEGDFGSSDFGGQSGQVEFREFIGTGPSRDDVLSQDERKRLIGVHRETNSDANIRKGKETRDDYKKLREGKVTLGAHRAVKEGVKEGMYLTNPILARAAQFSGGSIDRKVSPSATENNSVTNEADRAEPENKFILTHKPEMVHRHKPTPAPTPYKR